MQEMVSVQVTAIECFVLSKAQGEMFGYSHIEILPVVILTMQSTGPTLLPSHECAELNSLMEHPEDLSLAYRQVLREL